MIPFLHPYFERKKAKQVDPREIALKKLKRDTNFSYDRKTDSYTYKGVQFPAEEAINCVIRYGLKELKNVLEVIND